MENRKEFSERFANLIEQRGWGGLFLRDDFSTNTPYNPVGHIAEHDKGDSDKSKIVLRLEDEYSASNRLKLLVEGRGDDRWMTRPQAESLGGTIDPKVEGVDLEQWQYKGKDGVPLTSPELSSFTVFNAEDVIGFGRENLSDDINKYADNASYYQDLIKTLGFEPTERDDGTYYQKDGKGINYSLASLSYPMGEALVEKLGISDNADLCACLIGGLLESSIALPDNQRGSAQPMVNHSAQAELLRNDHNAIYRAARDADKAIAWVFSFELRPEIEREFELKKTGKIHAFDNSAWEGHGTDIPIDVNAVEFKDRHYINVPFEDRDELKAVAENAKFCQHAVGWWVPKDSDLSKVAKWESAVAPSEDLSNSPVVQEFADACKKQGLILVEGDPVMDNEFHKVAVEGSNIINTGAYRANLRADGPNGFIINSETGVREQWVYTGPSVHPNDIAALLVEAKIRRDERDKKFHAFTQHVEGSSRQFYFNDIDKGEFETLRYNTLRAATPENCPYLAEEKLTLPEVAVKVGDGGIPKVPHCIPDGSLFLDVQDSDGKIKSLLSIDNGKQTFEMGYRPEGCYHLVCGDKEHDDVPSVIVKDFAQAVRIHNASGLSVAVAFDDENLAPVFSSVFQRHGGDIPLVVAVDKAGDLEKVINDVHLVYTEFVAGNVVVENTPDLNAMFKDKGAEAVVDSVKVISDHIAKVAKGIEDFKAYRQSKGSAKSQSQETGLGA